MSKPGNQHIVFSNGDRFAERKRDNHDLDKETMEYNRELTRKRRIAEWSKELREINEGEL